ncbi:MAG: hypothetical protein EXX96DRAFT_554564 [Benjaminiella poitrasii]|nr:MAG: hypothetical protein EXX96DRAFT_554564 [Benjaminiella poitrasii]
MKQEKQSIIPYEKPLGPETETDLDEFIRFTNNPVNDCQHSPSRNNISRSSGESHLSTDNSSPSREDNIAEYRTSDEEHSKESSGDEEFGQIPIRPRQRFTQQEIDMLERVYQEHERPSNDTKRELAVACNTILERIQVWYQNRRAKEKKSKPNQTINRDTYDASNMQDDLNNISRISLGDNHAIIENKRDSKKRRKSSVEKSTSSKVLLSKTKKRPQARRKISPFSSSSSTDLEGQIQLVEPSTCINKTLNCPQGHVLHTSYYPNSVLGNNRVYGPSYDYSMPFNDDCISNTFYLPNFSNPGSPLVNFSTQTPNIPPNMSSASVQLYLNQLDPSHSTFGFSQYINPQKSLKEETSSQCPGKERPIMFFFCYQF